MSVKTSVRGCPCCGHGQAEVLHAMRFTLPAGSPLPAAYDLVACPRCGSCHADTPGSQADYDRYYADFSKYEDPRLASGGGAAPEDAARLRELARFLAGQVPRTARILDIGAANGGLLAALREEGCTALSGLDPSPRCVGHMRAAGFGARCGKLADLKNMDTPGADLVVLSHVLEHVVALEAALAAVRAHLAPGGLVYAEVPDAAAYDRHPRAPFYYFDSEHINHFSGQTLAGLLARHGFVEQARGPKALMLADGAPYPACWVLARKAAADDSAAALHASSAGTALRDALTAYIAQSADASTSAVIEDCAASGRPVIVWGAGQNTMRLMQSSSLGRCDIIAIVDGDGRKQGQEFAGRVIGRPQELPALAGRARALVLISAAIHGPRIAEELLALCPNQPYALV